ncbi:MAG: hypothetical protein ACO1NW_01255 [Chitinophagaceae bacterium]
MKKEVLKSYFEKTCSGQEAAEVELWLLDPQNAAAFDRFLETYWDEHVKAQDEPVQQEVKQRGTILRFLPRIAAAAAVIGLVVTTVVYLRSGGNAMEQSNALAAVTQGEHVPPVPDTAQLLMKPDAVKHIEGKEEAKPVEKRAKATSPKQASAVKAMVTTIGFGNTDSAAMAKHSVKSTRMSKVMINDVVLSKLGETERMAVLHQMALRVDFNNASFNDIAAVFRDKYGIVLELCASNVPENVKRSAYTAQFSNVTFPELMNDMSKRMMFSYTMVDNVVKVCFN